MIHDYTFFERSLTDHLWKLKWKTILARDKSRWVQSPNLHRGGYYPDAGSLRELLAFSIDPEPSDNVINRLLSKSTVAETMKKCHPQFWAMEEIMGRLLERSTDAMFTVELSDSSTIVSVATRAYFEKRISSSTMWAVVKLHNIRRDHWKCLSEEERKAINGLPWTHKWDPLFKWQNENACKMDESTNCLTVAQTIRFKNFVERSYDENWPTSQAHGDDQQGRLNKFRDNRDCVHLFKALRRKSVNFQRPCVFRIWS